MKQDLIKQIPIIRLSAADRLWLNELYKRGLIGDYFEIDDIWLALHHKLPKNYRPENIDSRLIYSSGERIRILGVVALERKTLIVKKINRAVFATRDYVLKNIKSKEVNMVDVAASTNFPHAEFCFYFQLASEYIHLYTGSSSDDRSSRLKRITVGEKPIFYNYREFDGIEKRILLESHKAHVFEDEYFSIDEKLFLNYKIDNAIEQLKLLEVGQEVIYTDIMNELADLKESYDLPKRKWWQLFLGKVAEMVGAGVISETVSKNIAGILRREIQKFLES
jgi:hypothetical protein